SCRDTPPFLAILVASHPRDVKARQAIRVTWGSHSSWRGHPVLTLFLLGQDTQGSAQAEELSLADESVLYGDII
ncbi:B3GL1 acetylgalactosaminyltransferase, partial [Neodrepanis coruscans]|nr:B3GL1 acetylgalactosaminyltransferase [Neodrepanis coruscans]